MMKSQEKFVVGVRLQPSASSELLNWVFTTTARAGDHVVALHFIDQAAIAGKGEEARERAKDEAKLAVLELLEPFRDLVCSNKMKAKVAVVVGESMEKALVEGVGALQATTLVLGTSRAAAKPWRQTAASYCSRHSPSGCSVLVVKNRKVVFRKEACSAKSSSIGCVSMVPTCEDHVDNPVSVARKSLYSKDNFSCVKIPSRSQDSKVGVLECCSPRAVLEGPGSSAESEAGSSPTSTSYAVDIEANAWTALPTTRETLGNVPLPTAADDGAGFCSMSSLIPQQKHCIQGLWRSFATKRWQSFPSSYRKKEMTISDPILVNPEDVEEDSFGQQDAAHSLLSAAGNQRRSWKTFTHEEISLATNNFDPENVVGKGGYAKVYKGVLPCGRLIAVKKHNRGENAAGKERDFLIELGIISHVYHPNTATLLGICIENGLHLVFQFSQYGSLQALLHCPKGPPLEWAIRYKVAIGVARGLHYLHEVCQRRIIHRDVKASNILLGPDFEPQIADFGLAKWLPDRWTHHTVSPIEGTIGYLAPEYYMHGIVDEKTDVFSYGVLLLELVTGRRPVDAQRQNLVVWAKQYLETENVKALADTQLQENYDANQMQRAVLVAALCVRQSAVWRPSMSQVLQLLALEETSDRVKADRLNRLMSKSHDFDYAAMDDDQHEEYCSSDDFLSGLQSQATELELNQSQVGPV
ncbi:hypothetical protein BDL97_03G025700 [Sphagnum fallax]|nr:hypothetical protein BDL97_03G025700 [Sphagnum fallax]